MRPYRTYLVLAALASAALLRPAAAGRPDPPVGDIVFAKDGALWRVTVETDGAPVKVGDVGDPEADVRAIAAAPDHRLLVLDVGGVAGWVQLSSTPGEVRRVAIAPCTGPGGPAPDAMSLVCPAGERTIVQPIAWKAKELDLSAASRAYLGPDTAELLVTDEDGIWAVSAIDTAERRHLSPHHPDAGLRVSPNGKRAVGRYIDAAGVPTLYSFRLDGKAVQRKIGDAEVPLAWSADGEWVLLEHEKRACIARAVGGEYKCWGKYSAVGLSPDSRYVLLAKDGNLYRAPIAGVKPVRPKLVAKDAGPAAVWLPAAAVRDDAVVDGP